jgi:DNA-binding response OmpR family regulator
MPDVADNQRSKAIFVVQNPSNTALMETYCIENGIDTYTLSDPLSALEACSENPPDLAIVQWDLNAMSGVEFLSELLKISWTTATVLVTDLDEETVHEKAEGLGILGRITDFEDITGLRGLLHAHENMKSLSDPENT